jgi:ABC-type multidrug transport system ATPase subunit
MDRFRFVDQADCLMGTLTVRETLLFTAELCLPESLPYSFKQQRVDDVLNDMRITHIADSKIGSLGMRSY